MSTIVHFPSIGLEFTVNRVAFSIGSFDVYWYGIILGLALAIGMFYAMRKAREFGIDQDRLVDLILVGTVAGIIGARLYYVAFASPGEFTSFWQIFDLRRGGVAFYGAVIFSLATAWFFCRRWKIKPLPVIDLAALGFLIGQGIGRWGNFVNQEAFGCNTTMPWGMTSETVTRYLTSQAAMLAEKGIIVDPLMPVHPTFLYESLWCMLGFWLLSRYLVRRQFDGEIALMYFAWNGVGRAFIEGLRTDSLYLGSVRISQILAIFGSIAAMIAILVIRGKIKSSPDKSYLVPYGHTQKCADDLALVAEKRAELKAMKDASDGETTSDKENVSAADKLKSFVSAAKRTAERGAANITAAAKSIKENGEKGKTATLHKPKLEPKSENENKDGDARKKIFKASGDAEDK
ncbi:MAG: prolipoprotein diacylglyceryl transferase [Oscillospiraceae bacterium]